MFLDLKELNNIISVAELNSPCQETLATLEFSFTKEELDSYLAWRTAGLAHKSSNWIKKAAATFWSHIKRTISKMSLEALRAFQFSKHVDHYAQSKVLNFTKGFLKYRVKLTLDPRYLTFDIFLEKPKVLKAQKWMTSRIVTKEDVEHVLAIIREAMLQGSLDKVLARQFMRIVLFGAYAGQRSYSTIAQLKAEQFREALQLEKPTVHIEAAQDNIRMEHYVPLHPQLAAVVSVLCDAGMIKRACLRWKASVNGHRNRGYVSRGARAISARQTCGSSLSSGEM